MIHNETLIVSGKVMYCDGCDERGPEAAYDNVDDVTDQADQMGWTQDDVGQDYCKTCTAKRAKRTSTAKRRKTRHG